MKGGNKRTRYTKEYTDPVDQPGGAGGVADSCAAIKFTAQLQKVTSAASTLRVGDELELSPKGSELRAIDESGVLCGNVLSHRNAEVLECISKGNSYKAVVVSIKGKTILIDVKIA